MKAEISRFDLDKKCPNVLLFGNGMLIGNGGISWPQFIAGIARNGKDVNIYKERQEDNYFQVPNTIITVATSEIEDTKRRGKYKKIIEKQNQRGSKEIEKLANLPFDVILTTNYTYELEEVWYSNYNNLSEKFQRELAYNTDERDAKYLIHTFNKVSDNAKPIWHIHGEARRPSSIILTHDEYIKLIEKIVTHNKQGKKYETMRNDLAMTSWIDYLLTGNVYVVGFGFDYAEFDMWWMLNRRLRMKNCTGKIVFYEPQKVSSKYKIQALKDAGVECRSLGFEINDLNGNELNLTYNSFYEAVINDIQLELGEE